MGGVKVGHLLGRNQRHAVDVLLIVVSFRADEVRIMNISRALLLVWALSTGWPAAVWCQDAQTEIQRNLLERQQRQQEFQLKQQQFEESLNPRLTPEQKRQIESLHLEQRQRQQELHLRQTQQFEQSRQNVKPESPDQQRLQLEIQNRQFQREQEQQFERKRQKLPQGN